MERVVWNDCPSVGQQYDYKNYFRNSPRQVENMIRTEFLEEEHSERVVQEQGVTGVTFLGQ